MLPLPLSRYKHTARQILLPSCIEGISSTGHGSNIQNQSSPLCRDHLHSVRKPPVEDRCCTPTCQKQACLRNLSNCGVLINMLCSSHPVRGESNAGRACVASNTWSRSICPVALIWRPGHIQASD